MVSFGLVMENELPNGAMERRFAEEDQPVQKFRFNTANKALSVRIQIGRTRWKTKALDARRQKQTAELIGVEAGAVVNEVTTAVEEAVKPVSQIARDLLHPSGMRFRDDSGDVHFAGGQTNDEEDVVTDEAKCSPYLHDEEVTRCEQFPVCAKEFFPCGARAALGRWINTFLLKDIGDSAARDLMP